MSTTTLEMSLVLPGGVGRVSSSLPDLALQKYTCTAAFTAGLGPKNGMMRATGGPLGGSRDGHRVALHMLE